MGSTSRFSDETNAYIDAAPLPPPDLAEEDDFMQDLIEYNLPQLHQHLEAPVPKSVPTPPKFSMASSNSPRKRTSRARPKLRANALEQLRNHWMAQPALLRSGRTKTRNFFERSNPMRKLDIRGRSSPASLTNRSLMSRLCGTTSRLDWASRTR